VSTANWIKLRVNVWDKAEVHYIAESCSIPVEHAVGILCKLWTWFDQHTENGITNKFGTKIIGKYTRTAVTDERDESVTTVQNIEILVTPFLEAMQEVEWIRLTNDGFWALTNWEEHNGKTAKSRATDQKRQAKSRVKKDKKESVTVERDNTVTREEKRREEKENKENGTENKVSTTTKKVIETRKNEFGLDLKEFEPKFGRPLLLEFFNYWSEHGKKDKKMRFEKQTSWNLKARIIRWKAKESTNKGNPKPLVNTAIGSKKASEYARNF